MSARTARIIILMLVALIAGIAVLSVALAYSGGLTLYLSATLATIALVSWLVAGVVWWFWG